MNRCESCPLNKNAALKNVECAAHSLPHPQFCNLAKRNGNYDVKIVEKSLEAHEKNIDKSELPPIKTQIKNFATSMIKWAQNGFKLAPKSVQEERMIICSECEHYIDNRCSQCGCFLEGAKLTIANEKCPLGKWKEWTGESSQSSSGCGCGK